MIMICLDFTGALSIVCCFAKANFSLLGGGSSEQEHGRSSSLVTDLSYMCWKLTFAFRFASLFFCRG